MSETLTIKPYARLITMLGDQLIKNELIALVEIIKNSYDADASWVKVTFKDFEEDFSVTPSSKIIIEDDGCGMDENIIKKHWLNPATPDKLKKKSDNYRTAKGRILQGDKGIGRFAVFKLGKYVKIISRRQLQDRNGNFIDKGEDKENILIYDFAKYDNDFMTEGAVDKDLFLEDLKIKFYQRNPQTIVKRSVRLEATIIKRKEHGTIIEIKSLKTKWSESLISRLLKEVGKMQPIFSSETDQRDFSVSIYKDEILQESSSKYREDLLKCMNDKAVLRVQNGRFNATSNTFSFELNGEKLKLCFSDPDIQGLVQYRKYFHKDVHYKTECGNFKFEFYVFDLNVDSENTSKYCLDKQERKMISDHRVYLYRDNIRVMPYGDPEDDWLGIDIARGTVSAGSFFSNNQIVGCVYISQKNNPLLKDKTNREGLIEEGKALDDFINVLKLLLSYLRKKPYAKYILEKNKKNEIKRQKAGRPLAILEDAKKKYADNKEVMAFLTKFEEPYRKEKKYFQERITKTENLAAVGLSVETASHDVMLFIDKTIILLDVLIKSTLSGEKIDIEELQAKLSQIRGNVSMIQTQLKDIQLLFPSTKLRTKNIRVIEIIEKVQRLYARSFNDNQIVVDIDQTRTPLIVKTTDAVLLQVFVNLFDNSLYWLKCRDKGRRVLITVDGNNQRVIFSDNGPGVKDDDKDYIFDAFYSGKGEEGRGLGLYIAKQLLERYDYDISLAEFSKDKILPGANFVLEFVKEG